MQGGRSDGFSRSLPGLVGALIFAGVAWGQAPQANAEQEVRARELPPPFQLRVATRLVTVGVVVRDAAGRLAGSLRKEDFRLFDNGQPEPITGFSVETNAPRAEGSPPAATAHARVAPVPQHFVGLYFDDLHMDAADVSHTRNAAWQYLSTALAPEDRVAIFTSSNRGGIDFTGDRGKLHEALFRLAAHSQSGLLTDECPAITEYEAFLIERRQDRSALDLAGDEGVACHCPLSGECRGMEIRSAMARAAQIWNQLDAQSLDTLEVADGIVQRMAAMPGKRILVLVSSGFLSEAREPEISALIDRALRQNVVINTIDAAGLYGKTYRNTNLAARPDLEARVFSIDHEGVTFQRDILASLAAGTGGTFVHNSNDFDGAFRETAQAPAVSYLLTFAPAEEKMDGKFHVVRVVVANGSGWSIQARRGYWAAAQSEPDQRAIRSLLLSQDERRDLPAAVLAQPEASGVTIKIHVNIQALPFRRQGDRNLGALIFDTALFDRDGKYASGKESSLEFRLTDARLEQLRKSGIDAETRFLVEPGTYRVRTVVRDAASNRLAALNCAAVVVSPPVQTAALPTVPALPAKPKKEKREKKKTRSMIDWSIAEFKTAMPEMEGLEPAQSQDRLGPLLSGAGQNVKAFFDTLPETSAHEQIDLERLDWPLHRKEEFSYLALPRPGQAGVQLEEYRTNAAGKRVEPQALNGGFVTKGFISMVVHFHPDYQADSRFRYLGRQELDGLPIDVVCFAQIPGKARVREGLHTDIRSLVILVQGVAWIDPEDYHIARMRTEVLEPHWDPDLQREITKSRFAAVHFKGVPQTFWLPDEVIVTVIWRRAVFRNRHRYSDFELFRVETRQTGRD